MLPQQIQSIITEAGAPPDLLRHLEMVREAVWILADMIPIKADAELAADGAAAHDLAKIRFPAEISGPGSLHAEQGEEILLELGLTPELAAFAPGHMFWDEDSPAEHVIVAAADAAWKGARSEEAENELARRLCESGMPEWEAWTIVDEAMTDAGEDGPARIHYQRTGQRMQPA